MSFISRSLHIRNQPVKNVFLRSITYALNKFSNKILGKPSLRTFSLKFHKKRIYEYAHNQKSDFPRSSVKGTKGTPFSCDQGQISSIGLRILVEKRFSFCSEGPWRGFEQEATS